MRKVDSARVLPVFLTHYTNVIKMRLMKTLVAALLMLAPVAHAKTLRCESEDRKVAVTLSGLTDRIPTVAVTAQLDGVTYSASISKEHVLAASELFMNKRAFAFQLSGHKGNKSTRMASESGEILEIGELSFGGFSDDLKDDSQDADKIAQANVQILRRDASPAETIHLDCQ